MKHLGPDGDDVDYEPSDRQGQGEFPATKQLSQVLCPVATDVGHDVRTILAALAQRLNLGLDIDKVCQT